MECAELWLLAGENMKACCPVESGEGGLCQASGQPGVWGVNFQRGSKAAQGGLASWPLVKYRGAY